MKQAFRFILSVVILCAAAPFAFADTPRFFSVMQDVPLMPGLIELGDQAVVFDKPGGRFAESLADLGGQSAESVTSYYAQSLPQFGWAADGQNRFEREGEVLAFEFEQAAGRGLVRVSLSPE